MSEVPMIEQKEIGKIQPKIEQEPTGSGGANVESAGMTFLSRLKRSPEIARHVLRLSAQRLKSSPQKMALTASAIPILAACNFGSAEKQNIPPPPEPTPSVSQVERMPSATVQLTEKPMTSVTKPSEQQAPTSEAPPLTEIAVAPTPTQEASFESPQPQEQQESKELLSYTPSVTIVDAAPSVPKEGIIQKEFISNDEMIRNMIGDKYVSKEQIAQEFGEDYEEKWDEIVDKYPQVLVYRFVDTYFNHGEDVAEVVDNTLEKSGLDSTGINILPLQKIFDIDSVEFINDSSGNPGISLNFDPQRIIKSLEDDPSRVVNGSFQVGNVELFQKTNKSTVIAAEYIDYEGNVRIRSSSGDINRTFPTDEIYTDAQGNEIPLKLKEEPKIKEIKSTSLSIVGAYTKEKAMENLPKLFEVCNAYPDKFFVFAGGNTGEDFREAMEALKDQRPDNLLITAEWLKGNYGGFDYEGPYMVYGKYGKVLGPDIYVNNKELDQPHGSSFSTPVISTEVDRLLKQGLSFGQVREKILASSDTHTLGLNDGTKPTVKVFNPTNLK